MGIVDISRLKGISLDAGARLFGVCTPSELADGGEEIRRILPGALSVVVVGVPHSRAAISSENLQSAQFDTIFSYNEVGRVSHLIARYLESSGHGAIAVPAFIPIDMSPPKYGMVGDVNWRDAAVGAGLGSYGESGLFLSKEYGPAVRIGGVVTDAEIPSGRPLLESLCTRCMKCVETCPAGALEGGGVVDKTRCGRKIFAGGFRAWRRFLLELLEGEEDKRREILGSQMSLDLWQNFMTGNYYYCFTCQAVCPAGNAGS